jgi:hypothetical protein
MNASVTELVEPAEIRKFGGGNDFRGATEMENKQTPSKKEITNDRNAQSLFDIEKEPERAREEAFDRADDDDELSFDLPRD